MTRLEHPFEPVYDSRARVLVLGTFPSEGSVAAGGYYGHKSNHFWRIMEEILPTIVGPGSGWPRRYGALRSNRIALWDVIGSCERDGRHEDGKIRAAKPNDVTGLLLRMPECRAVLCNGAEACRRLHTWFPQFGPYEPVSETVVGDGPSVWRLPSTSAASRRSYARKLVAWRWALHDEGIV